jgi:hypothetical protein
MTQTYGNSTVEKMIFISFDKLEQVLILHGITTQTNA